MTDLVEAHDQLQTVHIAWHYPPHEPRARDPYHAEFMRVRKALIAAGKYRCVICGSTERVELHHSHVELALQGGVDVARLDQVLGLDLTPAEFAEWIDSPGNLEPLCITHHRGAEGIHLLPTPAWEALRVWRAGLPLVEAHGNI